MRLGIYGVTEASLPLTNPYIFDRNEKLKKACILENASKRKRMRGGGLRTAGWILSASGTAAARRHRLGPADRAAQARCDRRRYASRVMVRGARGALRIGRVFDGVDESRAADKTYFKVIIPTKNR